MDMETARAQYVADHESQGMSAWEALLLRLEAVAVMEKLQREQEKQK